MNSVIFFAYLNLAHLCFSCVFTLVNATMILIVVTVVGVVLAVTMETSFYQMRNEFILNKYLWRTTHLYTVYVIVNGRKRRG